MLQSGPTNAPVNYVGLNVGTSMWNCPIPIFWGRVRLSTNAFGFYNFTAHPAQGKGKGSGGKNDQHTYTADCLLGLCEGVCDEVTNIWANGSTTSVSTLADLGMIFFSGTSTQTPWSLMETQFPAHALAYANTAYLAAPGLNLGESATIPDNAFEGVRIAIFSGSFVLQNPTGGWINPNTHQQSPSADCLMSDIITDFLTSVQYGMGFASDDLGSITQFATYQRAQGIFFSPYLVRQEKGSEIIDRWAQLANSWIYEAAGRVQLVPLGDSAVTGNGVTYTPIQDVAADLTLADFIAGKDEDPVKVERIDPADAHNRSCLGFTDRTLGYINNPVEFKADGLVDRYGLRDDSTTSADEIKDPGVAAIVADLIGQRAAYIRNTYAFKVANRRGVLWLPGTILTLTAPNIGTRVRVRVRTIDRDEKRELSVVAEEFPGTTGTYYPPAPAALTAGAAFTTSSIVLTLAASAPSWLTTLVGGGATVVVTDLTTGDLIGYVAAISGTSVTLEATALAASSGSADSLLFAPLTLASTPDSFVAPGNVNTPAIVEPDSAFIGGTPKIIIAASGGANWGGCTVNLSFDGTAYSQVGTITGPAKQGVLTAALATYSGANPDTTHTLAVDCTESLSEPATVTNADAAALRTLSLVAAQPTVSGGASIVPTNGELLAFGAVTATGTYAANLTYLERGAYGTAPSAHSIGDQFTLVDVSGTDGTSVAYPLPAQYVGQTIYLKLASFNVFGNSPEDLSTVVEYQYTPTGAGYGSGTAGAPATPKGLAVAATGYGNIGVGWSANPATDNVTTYSIYRANGSGSSFGSAALVWSGNALAYVDANVTAGSAYTYFVLATNAIGSSAPSAGVSTTATTGAVTAGASGGIALTGAVDGVNTTFTMASGLAAGALPLLSVNGTAQTYGTQYSISGTTLTFVTAPPSGATLLLSALSVSIPNLTYLF